MSSPATTYGVRFKGHWCASVSSGLARKPILLRAHAGEKLFFATVPVFLESERPGTGPADWDRLARLECARAIKRTDRARRLLKGDHMLRGAKTVERLLRDHPDRRRIGSGKRWKICPNPPQVVEVEGVAAA